MEQTMSEQRTVTLCSECINFKPIASTGYGECRRLARTVSIVKSSEYCSCAKKRPPLTDDDHSVSGLIDE